VCNAEWWLLNKTDYTLDMFQDWGEVWVTLDGMAVWDAGVVVFCCKP